VLDHHLADLMDRRHVSEVSYVGPDLLRVRSERCLVGAQRVTEEMAHGDIGAERLSFAIHQHLVDSVVLQGRAHLALDERQVFCAVVIVVEPYARLVRIHDADFDHRLLLHWPDFAIHRSARSPGMKQYSPARTVTKRGNPFRRRRTGVLGMVKTPSPSLLPMSGSCSVPWLMKLPSVIHWDWRNSNCLCRYAPISRKTPPRSLPSSSSTPSGKGDP